METGAETEHGRIDQNTDVRNVLEKKESGGTVQKQVNWLRETRPKW